jgi:integrase
MMLRLCLRESEVASLRWSMFSVSEGVRTVAFIGKWHKVSRLSVPDDVWAVLERWRSDFESETGIAMQPRDPVFTGLSTAHLRSAEERKKGVPLAQMGRAALYTLVNARLRDVGLEGARMGPHALRTTGATLAYEGGADLVACQMLLRHDSIETTRRFYLKRIDAEARTGMDKMPVRFRVELAGDVEVEGET